MRFMQTSKLFTLLPEELVQRHTVRSTDIDMGRHMNNVAYVRLLLDCFPASVLGKLFSIQEVELFA